MQWRRRYHALIARSVPTSRSEEGQNRRPIRKPVNTISPRRIYMTSYIVSVAKLAPSSALWIGTSSLLVFVILIPIWGALSDRIGRKPLLLLSSGGYIILAYPLFMMASTGSATLALIAQKQPIRRHDYHVYFLGVPAAKVPTSFDELRGGTRGRLKLHNFGRTPPRALPDSKRELQRAVADLYRWGAICRSGIELFLMKATWKPWFVCGSRTRNSVKRYEQLYRGAENPALLA